MLEAQVCGDGFSLHAGHDGGAQFDFLNDPGQEFDIRDSAMPRSGPFSFKEKRHATTVEIAFVDDFRTLTRLNAKLAGLLFRYGVEPQKKFIADIQYDFVFWRSDQHSPNAVDRADFKRRHRPQFRGLPRAALRAPAVLIPFQRCAPPKTTLPRCG